MVQEHASALSAKESDDVLCKVPTQVLHDPRRHAKASCGGPESDTKRAHCHHLGIGPGPLAKEGDILAVAVESECVAPLECLEAVDYLTGGGLDEPFAQDQNRDDVRRCLEEQVLGRLEGMQCPLARDSTSYLIEGLVVSAAKV